MLYRIGADVGMDAHVTLSPRRGFLEAVFVDPAFERGRAITGTFRADPVTEGLEQSPTNSPHAAVVGQRVRDFVAGFSTAWRPT
jgi:hypothetical protein